jgi:hypothetical protein
MIWLLVTKSSSLVSAIITTDWTPEAATTDANALRKADRPFECG